MDEGLSLLEREAKRTPEDVTSQLRLAHQNLLAERTQEAEDILDRLNSLYGERIHNDIQDIAPEYYQSITTLVPFHGEQIYQREYACLEAIARQLQGEQSIAELVATPYSNNVHYTIEVSDHHITMLCINFADLIAVPPNLQHLPKLHTLDLRQCVGFQNLQGLPTHLPNLHTLRLGYCTDLQNLQGLPPQLPRLIELTLIGCSEEIQNCERVQQLRQQGVKVYR